MSLSHEKTVGKCANCAPHTVIKRPFYRCLCASDFKPPIGKLAQLCENIQVKYALVTGCELKPHTNFQKVKRYAKGMEYELVDLAWLKAHEEINEEGVVYVIDLMEETGIFNKPILVDRNTGVILDGHHRYNACTRLGFKKIPAILLDYFTEPRITVQAWPGCGIESVTKQDVIDMGLSDEIFPPKSSKHTIDIEDEEIKVFITDLL